MNLHLISFAILLVSTTVYSQTCNNIVAGHSGIISISNSTSTDGCYFLGKTTNPAVPCKSGSCPPCANNQASRVLRVAGDWSIDAGSVKEWDEAEPLGLLTFDEQTCTYSVAVSGLKKLKKYEWKVII